MVADEIEVGSPIWWLKRLYGRLDALQAPLAKLDSYYTGDHNLWFLSDKTKAAFGGALSNMNDNWCGVVADAVEERLNPTGIRIPVEDPVEPEPAVDAPPMPSPGPGEPPGDPQEPPPALEAPSLAAQGVEADRDAWEMWQRNDLDAGSQMAHNEALVSGYSNILVWAGPDGEPVITPEAAAETIVETVPGSPRARAAALKAWRDDWTERVFATLYLPDAVYKFQSAHRVLAGAASRIRWEPRPVEGEDWPLPNPLGVVPMVQMANKQRLRDRADSEIRSVMPLQDIVNKLVADLLIASEFQAFRQRWATGLDIPIDTDTSQPIEPFKAAIDRLWVSDSEGTTFGEFAQADLRIFVAAIEMFVQHVATQSRTPPHYFYLGGQFPSGESIKSAETGLVAKTRRRMTHFSEPWEEAIRLAFAIKDDPRSEVRTSQLVWADPESRSEGEHTDALTKLSTIGVPNEILWERWGFSPQEIQRMRQMVQAEADRRPAPPVVQMVATPGTEPPAVVGVVDGE